MPLPKQSFRFLDRITAPVPLTDISMMTEEGKTIEWLGRAVKLRSKFLFETTENAATATVIRALESIRAKTRVVNEKTKYLLVVEKTNQLVASWKTVGVSKNRRRCVRLPNGEEYTGKRRVVFLTYKWTPGEHYDVFFVQDLHLKEMAHAKAEYYIVAMTFEHAQEYAIKRRRRTIRLYGGLAKISLGWLMHRVSEKSTAREDKSTKQARAVCKAVNIARNNVSGNMDAGQIGIYVKDGLDYAVAAVDGGQSGVNDAIKRAVNGIIGQINRAFEGHRSVKGWWEGKIACPFPEVKGSNKKG